MTEDRKKIIVIGHKSPDTDSICSSIAYAEFKNKKGIYDVIPGRAGNINKQTEFVLKYFNKDIPEFFSDVYPRLGDIMIKDPVTVTVDTPIIAVMKDFNERQIGFIPVMDKDKVVGIVKMIDIAERFSAFADPESARKLYTNVKNIAYATDAEIVAGVFKDEEREFYVFVGAMSEESFNNRIGAYDSSGIVVIVGDREDILKGAIEKRVGVLIITGSLLPSKYIIEEAKKNGTIVMITSHDSATASWLVRLSITAGHFCSKKFTSLSVSERTESVKKTFLKSGEKGIVVTNNEKLAGVITKSNFLSQTDRKLILVDHNEFSQAVEGADQLEVVEVIDHHRIADFHTAYPININIQPVGSTCTLVSEIYRYSNIELSAGTAGILLAGVISDTVTGRSPTTTDRDREIMKWLENISGVNAAEFSEEMFSSSSILDNSPPKDIILNDFKLFNIAGKKVGISQVEVVGFAQFHKIKKELLAELQSIAKKERYDIAALMVTDITYEVTLLQIAADISIYNSIKLPEVEKGIFEMKGVLSRKKQVVPFMFNILNG